MIPKIKKKLFERLYQAICSHNYKFLHESKSLNKVSFSFLQCNKCKNIELLTILDLTDST